MRSLEYIITFQIKYNAIVFDSPITSADYEKAYNDARLSPDAASYEISDYYSKYAEEFKSEIERLLAFTQDFDPYMSVSCEVTFKQLKGRVCLQFDNVTNMHLTRQALRYTQDLIERYTNDVETAYDYEPINACVAATGADKSFCKLDRMYDDLILTWSLYDDNYQQQYLVKIFEDTKFDREKCMKTLDELEIDDDDTKTLMKKEYDAILPLLQRAQSEFPGLKYQTEHNEQCFMAPSDTLLRVFFDKIKIEEY